jgi:hypothetical protein
VGGWGESSEETAKRGLFDIVDPWKKIALLSLYNFIYTRGNLLITELICFISLPRIKFKSLSTSYRFVLRGLCNDTVSIPTTCVEWYDDWRIMNLKGIGKETIMA